MPLVFVYGTLMRGGCRDGALKDQEFIAEATTEPRYRLFDCGSYPGMVDDADGVAVHGEIWRVSGECLARLDDIEGVDEGLYERREIDIADPTGLKSVEAYLYLLNTEGLSDLEGRWVN